MCGDNLWSRGRDTLDLNEAWEKRVCGGGLGERRKARRGLHHAHVRNNGADSIAIHINGGGHLEADEERRIRVGEGVDGRESEIMR